MILGLAQTPDYQSAQHRELPLPPLNDSEISSSQDKSDIIYNTKQNDELVL